MTLTVPGPGVRRVLFYVAAIVVGIVAWRWQAQITAAAVKGLADGSYSVGDPQTTQTQGFQVASTMIGLLTTLGTALLGAIGFLLAGGEKARSRPRHLVSAFLSAICVGVSLYYGYAGYLNMLFMANSGGFNPYWRPFRAADTAQFCSLLLAVFFFADFVIHDLSSEDRYARSQPVGGN